MARLGKELKRIEAQVARELASYSASSARDLTLDYTISASKNLFKQLVETGGCVFCFADSETKWDGQYYANNTYYAHEGKSSYSWMPVSVKVVQGSGPHVDLAPLAVNYKTLIDNFQEMDRSWTCYFTDYPINSTLLFVNRAGYAVGLEIPIGKGKLVLLPRFSNVIHAARLLIEQTYLPSAGAKQKSKRVSSVRQSWVTKFEFASKKRAVEELGRAKRDIEEYQRFEPLLDADGEELRQVVKLAFLKIGFQVVQPSESKPVQDLNLTFGKWEAVVEVKGKISDANITDLRQLLQYLVDQRDIEGRPDMNGIFVINHFCKIDLEKRGAPFTQAAVELAKKHKITLMSSSELYSAIGKAFDGKDTFEAIRDRIIQAKALI